VNLALFHTARLGDDMFRYPQRFTLVPPFRDVSDWPTVRRLCDFYLELGRVDDAETIAHEALAGLGEQPELLRRLAIVKIVKGQTAAARKFLRVLGDDIVHGQWARLTLRRLDEDPLLRDDPQVAGARELMLRVEDDDLNLLLDAKAADPSDRQEVDARVSRALETMCLHLLNSNPRNRMAFEYLMSVYLLRGDVERFAANLHRLDDFSNAQVPRHYQEAMLVYSMKYGQSVERPGRTVSDQTRARFDRFVEVLRAYGQNEQARQMLRTEFEDTYFLYYCFGAGAKG
jgi:hypothetical protein